MTFDGHADFLKSSEAFEYKLVTFSRSARKSEFKPSLTFESEMFASNKTGTPVMAFVLLLTKLTQAFKGDEFLNFFKMLLAVVS